MTDQGPSAGGAKLALMFPGQGSQALGMGCDLCAAYPQMRDVYGEASEVLQFDLEQLCALGPAETLARTDVTQPALLANSVGVYRILAAEGSRHDAAFGHSLGEYSALVATGAVSFADGLRLVRRRGAEMLRAAEANPGGMAALIGLSDDKIEQLCAGLDGVWPANFNSPGQVVVSGTKAALDELAARAPKAWRPQGDPAGRERRLSLAADRQRSGAAARGAREHALEHAAAAVLLGLHAALRRRRLSGPHGAPAHLAGAL